MTAPGCTIGAGADLYRSAQGDARDEIDVLGKRDLVLQNAMRPDESPEGRSRRARRLRPKGPRVRSGQYGRFRRRSPSAWMPAGPRIRGGARRQFARRRREGSRRSVRSWGNPPRCFIENDRARPRLRQLRFVARVSQKRERARIRTRQRRDVLYTRVGIAAQFAAEPNSEFSQGDRHKISQQSERKGLLNGPRRSLPLRFRRRPVPGGRLPAAGACDCRAVRIAGVISSVGVE